MFINSKKNIPSRPMGGYSKDAIKKMAVLFTDIVGSSKFFKLKGDIEGRKMLKMHQDLASLPINEFGGNVVKMLGDSVMAYFLNPEDALKSAIKIQQKFQAFNAGKNGKDEIHIRLCVHYGDGIVDEGDIFGDVVNMAAKFLPFASGDEILVSSELHSTIRNIPLVRFENFTVPMNSNNVLNDLQLLKVIWDSRIELDPTMKTLIHLRPVFNLGSKRFENNWNKVIAEKSRFWSANTVEKEQINNDRSISLIVRRTGIAWEIAKHVTAHLQTNMGQEANLCLPLQIIIDTGAFLRAGRVSLNSLNVDWNRIEPGEVYISETAYHLLNKEGVSNINLKSGKGYGGYFMVSQSKDSRTTDNFFRYQHALISGDHTPCFYCGNQSHSTMNCPSKMITELTGYVEKLGYMTLENINSIFLSYLQVAQNDLSNIESMNKNSPVYAAHNAFYELKSTYQLRLFRTIWNTKEDHWNRIRISAEENDRGGLLWIGLDCLRVSNLEQVESIINGEIKKKNTDYKVYCLAGLMYIERNQLRAASSMLKKALDLAVRTPEKIYIIFLRYRIHTLLNESSKAREMLRKILKLSPHCTEATYLDIVSKFSNRNMSSAVDQLIKLIRKNRDYYIISLIDPDLSDYHKKISENLDYLLIDARDKAHKLLPNAKEEVAELEKIMGKDAEEIIEANTQISKMEQSIQSNSYFGYLDVIHYSEDIFNLGNRIVKGREVKLARIENQIKDLIERCRNYIQVLPYAFMIRPAIQKLRIIENSVDSTREKIKHQGAKEFKDTLNMLKDYSAELITLEQKLIRKDAQAQFLGFLIKFLKKNLFFQSANLLIGLILPPILIHYLNLMIPELKLSESGMWHYQKILMILGGLTGIILSSLTSQKKSK
ncbi:MAG: adenylate/guanylate cyclase domain-containing protein [Desulfobacteraceae bacterium]|jgi:hypothetical protein